MPPRPSRPTIRYRPSSTAPGVNCPWSIDPELVSHPLSEGVAATVGASSARPVAPAAAASVGESGWPRACPHAGQNRAPSTTEAWQAGQVTRLIVATRRLPDLD